MTPRSIKPGPVVQNKRSTVLHVLEGHLGSVYSVAFSPVSKRVVSDSDDNTIRLWNATTDALLQVLEGHLGPVYVVAFSLDGEQFASGSWDKAVQL